MKSLRWLSPALLVAACSGSTPYIYGTRVTDSQTNRTILGVVEKYRMAVERKDTQTLLTMASNDYWEDGGTPTGADDYGFDGLRDALSNRFARADNIRYSMRYLDVKPLAGNRAAVDVMIDASYSIQTPRGVQRLDMRDQNEMVLQYDGRNWKFVSGM